MGLGGRLRAAKLASYEPTWLNLRGGGSGGAVPTVAPLQTRYALLQALNRQRVVLAVAEDVTELR